MVVVGVVDLGVVVVDRGMVRDGGIVCFIVVGTVGTKLHLQVSPGSARAIATATTAVIPSERKVKAYTVHFETFTPLFLSAVLLRFVLLRFRSSNPLPLEAIFR